MVTEINILLYIYIAASLFQIVCFLFSLFNIAYTNFGIFLVILDRLCSARPNFHTQETGNSSLKIVLFSNLKEIHDFLKKN